MANDAENLMQRAAFKPSLQAEIGGGMAERHTDCRFPKPRPGKRRPKGRYFFRMHEYIQEQNGNIVKVARGAPQE